MQLANGEGLRQRRGRTECVAALGGGVRRCIGAGFSLMEGTTVVREILARYILAPARGRETQRGQVRDITTVQRDKARIVVTPCSPS